MNTNNISKEDEKKIFENLYQEISSHIIRARENIVRTVNHEMVYAYWYIGKRIVEVEQGGELRAQYGKNLLDRLSSRLTNEFGRGFSVTNLRYFRQFYLTYSNQIHHKPCDEFGNQLNILLSWSHYRALIKVIRAEARSFYEKEAIANNWSVPELNRQIGSLLFDRLAMSKDKQGVMQLATKGQIIKQPQDILKDPIILEFLDIPEPYVLAETKLESALITHLQKFLLEMGKGFAFIGRQQRLTLDGDHFYCDLVFYHVVLKCYVLLDIKVKPLSHADLGQMLLYVNYYDREKRSEGDNPTIGLVLCTDKNESMVKYLLDDKNKQIFASKYQFYLPTEQELQKMIQLEAKELKIQIDKTDEDAGHAS